MKVYKALELMDKFSNKRSAKSSINRLLKKFGKRQCSHQTADSSRPRSTHTEENIDLVNELVNDQHKSKRYAADSQNGLWKFDNQLSC